MGFEEKAKNIAAQGARACFLNGIISSVGPEAAVYCKMCAQTVICSGLFQSGNTAGADILQVVRTV